MSHKIAVVEDDMDIQTMYKFKLEREGFTVATAKNGLLGLEVAERFQPDLILLDLMMPVMNGAEMLVRLRAAEWGSSMRVVVLTNLSKDEAPQALRFLNVDRYIVKAHHTPAQVIQVVHEILGQKRA
ncbi:MAG TPA: response regulator [Candidatus Saccharimonadales bacterium]|nr:response regulator [Candidatus Saccharimonadales bacterium]